MRIGINKCARESGFDRKTFIRKLVRGLPVKRDGTRWGTRGQTGGEPGDRRDVPRLFPPNPGNHKIKTKRSLVRCQIFSVKFFLWLDCLASWSPMFPIMLRSGGMLDKSFSPAMRIASLILSCCGSIRNSAVSPC